MSELPKGWDPWEEKKNTTEQIKLLRMDFVNTFKDIDIIKKHINNMQKILREILKRVSL